MLRLENVCAHYGPIEALHAVSLEVRKGEIVAVIGANGAGKTTLMRVISRLHPASSGQITFMDEDIGRVSPEDLVGKGMAHVPQGRRIFPGLTVWENLEVATASWRKGRQSIQADLDRVYHLFPILKERRNQLGWSLSGGEQQMLAVGRALMARPKLLLLDEPSLGLAPKVVADLFAAIKAINGEGVTILLVEQNARAALGIADRGVVIEMGSVILSESAGNLLENEEVKKAYLGG